MSTSKRHRELRERALLMYGKVCMCCGKTEEHGIVIEADHIFPRLLKPDLKYSFANYQILCDSCNSSKGASFVKDYRYEDRNMKRYCENTKSYLKSIEKRIARWWEVYLEPKKVKTNFRPKNKRDAGDIVKPKWLES